MAESFIETKTIYNITVFNYITGKIEKYRDDILKSMLYTSDGRQSELYTLFRWGYIIPECKEDYSILGMPKFWL